MERTKRHDGEYFQIIYFKGRYLLYYCIQHVLKITMSDDINNFNKNPLRTIMENVPRSVFCIIKNDEDLLYMLCGCHTTLYEKNEFPFISHAWAGYLNSLLNPYESRKDKKNGMYLFQSRDGFNWELIYDRPVLHSFISSDTVNYGEIGFDTSPYLIKMNDWFYFYGRLNTNIQERQIYMRKSKDLINWSLPEKIIIKNENNTDLKKNYYNIVILNYENELYGFCPYFEASDKECKNGKTIIMKSKNGMNWEIIGDCLHHKHKYKHRINDVKKINGKIQLFYRANVLDRNQYFVSYNINLFK